MTFEAYMNTIRAKTGKGPRDFFDEAIQQGSCGPTPRPWSLSPG